jgi:hypothetical protein
MLTYADQQALDLILRAMVDSKSAPELEIVMRVGGQGPGGHLVKESLEAAAAGNFFCIFFCIFPFFFKVTLAHFFFLAQIFFFHSFLFPQSDTDTPGSLHAFFFFLFPLSARLAAVYRELEDAGAPSAALSACVSYGLKEALTRCSPLVSHMAFMRH